MTSYASSVRYRPLNPASENWALVPNSYGRSDGHSIAATRSPYSPAPAVPLALAASRAVKAAIAGPIASLSPAGEPAWYFPVSSGVDGFDRKRCVING